MASRHRGYTLTAINCYRPTKASESPRPYGRNAHLYFLSSTIFNILKHIDEIIHYKNNHNSLEQNS